MRKKVFNTSLLVFVSVICLSVAGCKIPQMKMNDLTSVKEKYKTVGLVEINKFEDKRPKEEKIKEQTAINKMSPQVWSGNTDPELLNFFQTKLKREAEKSQLFRLGSGKDVYTLDGEVYSMKVERNVTIGRYCTLGLIDFPKLNAVVKFKVTVKKQGKVIYENTIEHVESERYWAMTEFGWGQVSGWAGKVLERAITNSIKKLFDDISSKIK